jgi:hypothetical protein
MNPPLQSNWFFAHWPTWSVAFYILGLSASLLAARGDSPIVLLRDSYWLSDEYALRLGQACAVHEEIKARPTWLYVGAASTIAILVVLEMTSRIPPFAAMALWSLILASCMNPALRSGRSAKKRVAVLRPRRTADSLPPPWLLALAVAATAILVMVSASPHERMQGFLIACSSALIAVMAWRFASSPTILRGNDPLVEECLDRLLRFYRARNLILLAVSQLFFFQMFAMQDRGDTFTLSEVTMRFVASLIVDVAYVFVLFRAQRMLMRVSDPRNIPGAARRSA